MRIAFLTATTTGTWRPFRLAGWTSVAAEDPFVVAAAGTSRLRLADLVALAALVQERRA